MTIKKGATDQSLYFKMIDSVTGVPETALTITNMSATYVRNRAASVTNALTALAAATTAHTDNKGIAVDATNTPGLYRVDFPDAAFATGADKVILAVTCAGCDPAMKEIELVDYELADVKAVVDDILVDTAVIGAAGAGLTALATQASVNTVAGYVDTEVAAIKSVVDDILADTAVIGTAGAGLTAVPWNSATWGAQVAASVWNAATATYGSGGSYGALIETNLDVAVSTVGGGSLTEAGIAGAVWEELLSGHVTGGSAGAALTGAGSAGDPWTAPLGGYGSGTAGKLMYDNLDATVSSRATQTSVDAVAGYVDTEIAAIKAKTDNLPSDPADASDIAAAFSALSGKVDAVDDLLDTEMPALTAVVASIQADTNDIQTRLPAALVGGRMDVTLSAIDGSTTALAAFKRGVKGNVIGTVGVGSTTTSVVSSALTPAGSVSTQFKGRILTFSDDTTTAALRGQSTDITASSAAATPTFTVTALTTAPVSTDSFVIT